MTVLCIRLYLYFRKSISKYGMSGLRQLHALTVQTWGLQLKENAKEMKYSLFDAEA